MDANVRKRLWVRLSGVLGLLGLVAVLLGTAMPGAAHAAGREGAARKPSLGDTLDRTVRRQLDAYRIPGAAVVVVRDGRQVYAKGYGVEDADGGKRVSPERTGFFMGSDAKVFTAMAVLKLAESGKLDLRADVNRYLDDVEVENTYPGHPVTARHLLTHTAGFDNAIVGRADARPVADTGELGKSLAAHQPRRVRPPGRVASYDNYGVALAGHLVEEVSGEPFARYVERNVLRPLGMRSTSFAQPLPGRLAGDVARGHRPSGDGEGDGDGQATARGQYGAWSPTGAGAVTTAADMGRLMRAQLDRKGALSEKSYRAMQKRQFANDGRLPGMGYILEERRRDGHRMLVKDGDVPGFHDNMALLPDRATGVYVAYNGDGEDGRASLAGQEVAERVADHLYGKPRPVAAKSADGDDGDDSGVYEGEYRSTRTSRSDLTRAADLTGAVIVSAGDDGTLTTEGPLSRDPDVTTRHWVPVGDGEFREKGGDGQDLLGFRDGRLTVSTDPSVAYERAPWYEAPSLHRGVLLGSLAALVLSALGWGVAALVRTVRGLPAPPPGARVARGLVWCVLGLVGAAVVCFMKLVSDPNVMNEAVFLGDSALMGAVPLLLRIAMGVAGCVVVCAVLSWWRGWWGVAARIHYAAVALASALVLGVAASYHLAW
ncbi:serine hydrolase domain-containing protein [Streptomyces sp. NPDC048172]|uniref:serine hydrolase domain-containing protein n=1 Tax=Streptomyces sp. NPDC048172 TaxID=3365505 RepID=UPI003710173A